MTNISSVERDEGLFVVKSLDRSLLYNSFTAYLNIFPKGPYSSYPFFIIIRTVKK